MAASCSGAMIVPVGFEGDATTSPAGATGSASSISMVGWNPLSGPQSISTTWQPCAASTLR